MYAYVTYACSGVGGWDRKPYIVTMAQMGAVADALAAALDAERQQTRGDLGWGHRRLSAERVKQALSVTVLGDPAAGTKSHIVEPVIIGRLCGHGVAGGIVLADATGRVPVVFDGTSELDACHAEQLWLAGSWSLVGAPIHPYPPTASAYAVYVAVLALHIKLLRSLCVCLSLSQVIEFSPASVAGLTWYYALDLPSATCLFHHQARVADTQVPSLPLPLPLSLSVSLSPPSLSSLCLCG